MSEFEVFYQESYAKFYRFLILQASNLNNIDDILQNAYLALYKKMKKQKIENLEAYLYKVGWNLLKKERKLSKECSLEENMLNSSSSIEEKVELNEDLNTVWKYVKTKEVLIQKAFYLYYLGMSIKDIAKNLKVNESQVKNYIYRTRKELKEMMTK